MHSHILRGEETYNTSYCMIVCCASFYFLATGKQKLFLLFPREDIPGTCQGEQVES